ncbi:response regulator [Halobacteriales archaeon Cl-PHB]
MSEGEETVPTWGDGVAGGQRSHRAVDDEAVLGAPGQDGSFDRIDVLHVDDHADLLDLSQEFLSREDERISVTTETRARNGLDRIEAEDVDAVVSDYQMPGMNGIEFLEEVRRRHPDLPFIIFTGKSREEVAVEALNLGADRYLQKGGDPASQYGLLADAIVQSAAYSNARQQLHESEERYRSLVESLPDVVFITDYDSRMLWANSALERNTGLTVEDFQVPQEENPFIHPEDAERIARKLDEFVESDRKYSEPIDNRFLDADGDLHWYSSIVAKVTYEGEPALQFLTREVTERHRREEQLRENLRRYRTLAEAIPDAMVTLFDEDLRYTALESDVLEGLPVSDDDLLESPIDAVAEEAPFGTERAAYEAVFEGQEQVVHFERDGTRFERRLVPVRDGDGVTTGLELTLVGD